MCFIANYSYMGIHKNEPVNARHEESTLFNIKILKAKNKNDENDNEIEPITNQIFDNEFF